MSIGEYLTEFKNWLLRESRCPRSDENGSMSRHKAALGATDNLVEFTRLHSPGGLNTSTGIAADRAPLLMSFTRHRRIPINWLAVVEGKDLQDSWADDALRRRIETLWLIEKGDADKVPRPAVIDLDEADYCVRIFYPDGLAGGSLFNEQPVPKDSLFVQENPARHRAPRFYALVPHSGKNLDKGSPWADVREVVEIFKRGAAQEQWVKQVAGLLRNTLPGSSVDWPIEPVALPVLSSRIGPRAFSASLKLEWHRELIDQVLYYNVVRTAAPGTGITQEAYWTLDETARKELLQSDGRPIGDLLIDKAKTETKVLTQLTNADEWIIKAGKRRYLVKFRPELSPAERGELNLAAADDYATSWEKHIKGLVPLAWAPDPNATAPEWYPFGYMHNIDLSPQLITEEFSKLKAAYDVAAASGELGDAIVASIKTMIDKDPDYVRVQADHARNLKSQAYLPRARIVTLKQRAAKLGYQLATGFSFNGLADDEILVPTGPGATKTEKVPIGRLYVTEQRTASYSVMQSENVTSWNIGPFNPFGGGDIIPGVSLPGLSEIGDLLSGLGIVSGGFGGLPIPGLPGGGLPIPGFPGFGVGPTRHRREYPVTVTVQYTGLREADIDMEPWEALRQKLQFAGFQCLVAETSNQGYLVDGNVPLREVLGRCLVDEQYRQNLAIFIPIYQQDFDQGLVKVRYVVAIRPEPGCEPLGFPSIFCEEDLSYKAEWRGTELGELLHSISLAPGEEREVAVTRTVDRKTERVDSITSVLDVTKSDKFDFQTSLQETFSKEQNAKNTSNWNVNASASYGPFSAGGGGGGTQESSVRDFAETIKKTAMQSSREMRVNQKQEIKSSTTTSVSISSSESTKSTFSNINQGRTLNIQFYEINNIYKAGLVVENLKLTYTPSVELIQGLGIRDVLTFGLRDLGALLACANNDVALTGGTFLYDLPTLERRILRTVVRTILREYVGSDALEERPENTSGVISDEMVEHASTLFMEGARAFGLPAAAMTALEKARGLLEDSLAHTDTRDDSGGYLSTLDECQRYTDILTKLYQRGQVLEPHTLTVPSTATYADAQVGSTPSTEPYSERMREAEIWLKYAEIDGRQAEADARRRLAGLPVSSRRSTVDAELDRNVGGKLRIQAYPPFEAGEWTLLCDSKVMARVPIVNPTSSIEIAPVSGVAWPTDGGHSWMLMSPDSKERVGLPIY
jgi:hypothetical protein